MGKRCVGKEGIDLVAVHSEGIRVGKTRHWWTGNPRNRDASAKMNYSAAI